MFNSLTERGAVATLDALVAGAANYVTKPTNVGSAQIESIEVLIRRLTADPSDPIRVRIVETMTANETSLFSD